ncbi:MAG TPA: tryptophan synthase subunit alpha [Coleofasciculaceae cyanobacterium]|jgi:tryptophan synthase alpha chain
MTALTTHRYAERFAELTKSGQKAFIPFTILGWPNRGTSRRIIQAMIDGGASALELGLAFSDPMADGPVIQQADVETLATGFRVNDALALIREIRLENPKIPIGLLVYYNLVLARGVKKFFRDAADAGVDGVLIADLPPESASEVVPAAKDAGVQLIFIVSPLTSDERLQKIATLAGGFLYVVSRLGVTGVEDRYDSDLKNLLGRIRLQTNLPVCVGFGISTPEHARQMAVLGADGVITGSRMITLAREHLNDGLEAAIRDFVQAMQAACR